MQVRLHPDAALELEAAADWYEERREGLGEALLEELLAGFDAISIAPLRWPRWPGLGRDPEVRRIVLERFPFALACVIHRGDAVVLAVAHTSREPGYWRKRIQRRADRRHRTGYLRHPWRASDE